MSHSHHVRMNSPEFGKHPRSDFAPTYLFLVNHKLNQWQREASLDRTPVYGFEKTWKHPQTVSEKGSFITPDLFDPMRPTLHWRSHVRMQEEKISYLERTEIFVNSAQYWQQKYKYNNEILQLIRTHKAPTSAPAPTGLPQTLPTLDSGHIPTLDPNEHIQEHSTQNGRKRKALDDSVNSPSRWTKRNRVTDYHLQSCLPQQKNPEKHRSNQIRHGRGERTSRRSPGSRQALRASTSQRNTSTARNNPYTAILESYYCGGYRLRRRCDEQEQIQNQQFDTIDIIPGALRKSCRNRASNC